MINAATQPDDALTRLIEGDVKGVCLAEGIVRAVYRPTGYAGSDDDLKTVDIAFSSHDPGEKPVPGAVGQVQLGGSAGERRKGFVEVPSTVTGETVTSAASGVGDAGGVVNLKPGDIFVVPGKVVGASAAGAGGVSLVVGKKIRPEVGEWTAEVSW